MNPTTFRNLIVLLLAASLWLPGVVRAQDDNPFSETPAPTPGGNNPFAETTQTPAPANPENPFDSPPPADPENPFAEPPATPAPDTGSPFDAPPAENPFNDPAPGPGSPFERPSEPAPGPFEDVAPGVATPAAPAEPGTLASAIGRDVRGLYVIATARGFQNVEQTNQLVADFEAGGFNRLYLEVRNPFGVAYQSDLEQSLPFVLPGFENPFYEVRRRLPVGTEVYAVVTLLPVYNATVGPVPPETNPAGRNPGLINRSVDNRTVAPDNRVYLDPGNPEAVAYLNNLLGEIQLKLGPDGFLLRNVQYPGKDWGYSEQAVLAFRREVGGVGNPDPNDPVWCSWRRAQLASLLKDLRLNLERERPGTGFSVELTATGRPPANWEAWVSSPVFTEQMQDWLSWCREGIIRDVVVQVHERMAPQGNMMEEWVAFLNNNVAPAVPVVSIAGGMNFQLGFTNQYASVRGRGVGTVLHHYAEPLRSSSRGFFASLPNIIFHSDLGNPIPGRPIQGQMESRVFAQMPNPPAQFIPVTPTPVTFIPQGDEKPLSIQTPVPEATPTPVPTYVPDSTLRRIVMTSGREVEAVVLEVTVENITIQPQNSARMVLPRSLISEVHPPL